MYFNGVDACLIPVLTIFVFNLNYSSIRLVKNCKHIIVAAFSLLCHGDDCVTVKGELRCVIEV